MRDGPVEIREKSRLFPSSHRSCLRTSNGSALSLSPRVCNIAGVMFFVSPRRL